MGLTLSNTNGGNGRLRLSGGTGRMRVYTSGTIDQDAQAFITAAAITDPTQQSAINSLVINLKGYGVWTKMKALYPMVGGTASQHKFNLKNPLDTDAAFRLVFNGGWTHSTNGALPNGTNAYADTKLVPNIQLTLNNTHLSFYSRTQDTSLSGVDVGSTSSGPNLALTAYFASLSTGLSVQYVYPAYTAIGYAGSTQGLFIGSRINITSNKLYRNSTVLGTNTATQAQALPSANLVIGANSGLIEYQNRQCAFSSIGDGLTDTEAANYYTAVQTFQTTLGRQVGVPIVSDSDAQAFLNAAVITDTTQANAVNTLVTSLKGYGLWTKMNAIYPFVGGTASTHKFNLKNPLDTNAAFRLTFSGGWTHSATGALPNGTNGYADSNLIPSTTLQLDSVHMSGYIRTDTTSGGIFGCYNAGVTNGLYTNPKFSSGIQESRNNSGAGGNAVSTDSRGFWINTRVIFAQYKIFRNSIINQTSNTNTTGLCTVSAYIGSLNLNGTPEYQNREIAFSSIGDGLTDTESNNYYTAVQAFQTTLSRQV
jgi:hypothetical protein